MYVCSVPQFFQFFVAPWTVACQAPPSMGILQARNWSGVPFPPPGDLPDPGIEPVSVASPPLTGRLLSTSSTWEAPIHMYACVPSRLGHV